MGALSEKNTRKLIKEVIKTLREHFRTKQHFSDATFMNPSTLFIVQWSQCYHTKPTSNMELHWNVIIFLIHIHIFNNKIKYNCIL